MNKTLNERARSMRLYAGLPKTFWVDAISTAAYLINRGPSVPLNGELSEEVWTSKEVTLLHLRVFGCVSYVHVDSNDRDKLDPKSRKYFFIGYGSDDFGYRFWDEENRKIIRQRNVIFNEKLLYKHRSDVESEDASQETHKSTQVELEEILEDVLRKF